MQHNTNALVAGHRWASQYLTYFQTLYNVSSKNAVNDNKE